MRVERRVRAASSMTVDARELAGSLARWTREQIETLVERYFTGWQIPSVFAGYPVGPDVRADLAYTLALLDNAGEDVVAGTAAPQAIASVLRPIDGPGTHTFASYRVSETLRRYGDFSSNQLLESWSAGEC